MSRRKRLENLERRVRGGEIELIMLDGEVITITGNPQKIFATAIREQAGGSLSRTTKLIARSIKSFEPDGGTMIDLARSLLNSSRDDGWDECFISPLPSTPEPEPEPEAKVIDISKGTQ